MYCTQADLEMAERRVAQGEKHVAHQEITISWLSGRGHTVELAEKLLEGSAKLLGSIVGAGTG